MLDDWLKICLIALKSKSNIFETRDNKFEFKIFKFKGTDKGFMIIWNVSTLNAFTISRMSIDDGLQTEITELETPKSENSIEIRYTPENLIFENSKPY